MKTSIILILLIFICLGVIVYVKTESPSPVIPTTTEERGNSTPVSQTDQPKSDIVPPLSQAASRIAKKPLGIYVKPGASPVNPEKFTGYHTGTDFEILPGEAEIDVPVDAICSGKILRKEIAQGYGGMVVTSCTISDEAVTVVYGHIRLSSVTQNIGDLLEQSQQFAVLGTGYSPETSGERKHLHLGIHKGESIDTRGYVSDSTLLANWLDYQKLIANL